MNAVKSKQIKLLENKTCMNNMIGLIHYPHGSFFKIKIRLKLVL